MRNKILLLALYISIIHVQSIQAGGATPTHIQLQNELITYGQTVNRLIVKEQEIRMTLSPTEPAFLISKLVQKYYQVCLTSLAQLEEFSKNSSAGFSLPSAAIQQRLLAFKDLGDDLRAINQTIVPGPKTIEETNAYKALAKIFKENWRNQVQAEIILFDRKYFSPDDPGESFWLEPKLNSSLSFTQFDASSSAWGRQYGVSPWEATIRFEPFMTLESETGAGLLFSTGLLWNFLPDIVAGDTDNKITAADDFYSKWIKRTGVRVGAGGDFRDGGPHFVGGAGVQVASFTLWGLYSDREDSFILAVSASDLDWVKKALPFFK